MGVRWPFLLIAFALTACQPQASARVTPSPLPASPPGDLIYVQDPNGPRMLELDWSGKLRGTISAQGLSSPSPDGSRFIRATDHTSVEDSRGLVLGTLDADLTSYGLSSWADDDRHICGIVFPSEMGPETGTGSLWIAAPGEKSRTVGPVGQSGSNPSVAACSIKNHKAIVAGGLFPHWPPETTRYLISTGIEVMNLATGAVEYQHQYPLGYLAGQGIPGVAPDWVLVSASPDGHYVAESGVFNGTTAIRELPSGKIVESLHGSVRGFSWDGSRVVVSRWNGGSDFEAELVRWADQKVIWHRSAFAQSMLARPDSADVLIGISGAEGGAPELVVVNGAGTATTIVRDALVTWPCPCPAGP